MISHNALMIVSENLPSAKSVNILNDLATELAINPEDTNIQDLIKLELGIDNLWYKTQENEKLKMGLFVFSEKPIPVKLLFALNKLTTSVEYKPLNITNFVAFTLLKAHNQAGSNIHDTHRFIMEILKQMREKTEPKDQHVGCIMGNTDFKYLEEILKTLSNYKSK